MVETKQEERAERTTTKPTRFANHGKPSKTRGERNLSPGFKTAARYNLCQAEQERRTTHDKLVGQERTLSGGVSGRNRNRNKDAPKTTAAIKTHRQGRPARAPPHAYRSNIDRLSLPLVTHYSVFPLHQTRRKSSFFPCTVEGKCRQAGALRQRPTAPPPAARRRLVACTCVSGRNMANDRKKSSALLPGNQARHLLHTQRRSFQRLQGPTCLA